MNDLVTNFNVGEPTKENIEYAFKNLLFYVTASSYLKIYKDKNKQFKQVLTKIQNIFSKYVNTNQLSSIEYELLQDIKFDLIDLDTETKNLKSYYSEWSLMWLEAIISLRISEIKSGGEKYDR